MAIYNLIEYSDNYSKASINLWQYCRNEPAVNDGNVANATTNLLKLKKITGETGISGKKDIDIIIPLKYLSKFWKTLEMPLTNCEINLIYNLP